MSLLLKALQQAERGSELSLEPIDAPAQTPAMPNANAQAAASLMLDKQASAEKRRLLVLLAVLVLVVLGMGVYFYLAVYKPWLFLPKPPAPPLAAPSAPAKQSVAAPALLEPLTPPLPAAAAGSAPVEETAPAPPRQAAVTQTPAAPAKPAAASKAAADGAIRISGGSSASSPGGVQKAYQLLQDGRLDEARHAYESLRAQEPQNTDVLLGLGLIAQQQGRHDEAAQFYLKALDVDPKNAFAQASLSTMIARADPLAAEKKLQALIAQQPAAFLYSDLATVLAAQNRWPEAQQAYFEAQRLQPEAPDYAFNLAVSLERMQQPRAALEYYQRALRLAQNRPATFDVTQAKARVQALQIAH